MEINIRTKEDLESLIERWNHQKLPKSEWTHEAHIAVATWYNWHHDPQTALELVRPLIIAHNEYVGTPNSDNEGYHETITKFWIICCSNFMNENPCSSPIEAHLKIMNSSVVSSNYPLQYYSKGLLFSVKARHHWVESDLKPFE